MASVLDITEAIESKETNTSAEPSPNLIVEWMEEIITLNPQIGYTHRLLREHATGRNQVRDTIRKRVEDAHADAIRHLRKVAEETLDPLGAASVDPAYGYPSRLPLTTLKGYFGEILAAVVAETISHFGIDGWSIPAYPFRFHSVAFDYLEKIRQGASVPRAIPGRTGDDMLAFFRETDGRISKSLVCEAKCTNSHQSALVAEVHLQISSQAILPVEIRRLVELLRDYGDYESQRWRRALGTLYLANDLSGYQRYDMVCYVCGQEPKRESTWISVNTPHPNYQGGRSLEAIEIHLFDVDKLVLEMYGAQGEVIGDTSI